MTKPTYDQLVEALRELVETAEAVVIPPGSKGTPDADAHKALWTDLHYAQQLLMRVAEED
jgi:hypothetical protein